MQATFTMLIMAATFGSTVVVVVYGSPDAPMPLPDHNLQGSWDIDFDRLGCTGEQVLERLEIGLNLAQHVRVVYLVTVVAGSILTAVCRLADSAGDDLDRLCADVAGGLDRH